MYIYLHELAPFSISRIHVPLANSPQLCVVMKAQLLKPSREVSRTRFSSRRDRVPQGDVRKIWISPRRLAVMVMRACTCSRYLTRFPLPTHPSVYRGTVIFPFIGIRLRTGSRQISRGKGKGTVLFNDALNTFYLHIIEREREIIFLFNGALNTFYLRLYGIIHMVKDHSESERGNPFAATWATLSD